LNNDLAGRLVELGVASLHEAAGRRHLIRHVRLLVGEPFAGPALTVGLPAGDNLGVHLALEAAEPGAILCVGSAGRGVYGVIGELLVEAARARGVAGLVVEDGIRDGNELEPPPAIAACGWSALGTVKRRLRQPVGSDIALGGTLVRSGDWVICDRDGIVVLGADTVEAVVRAADGRVTREMEIRQQLGAGISSREIFGLPSDPEASLRSESQDA
jgi:4-hydroxy-4-methyl-2-oxoglutarate aldolase